MRKLVLFIGILLAACSCHTLTEEEVADLMAGDWVSTQNFADQLWTLVRADLEDDIEEIDPNDVDWGTINVLEDLVKGMRLALVLDENGTLMMGMRTSVLEQAELIGKGEFVEVFMGETVVWRLKDSGKKLCFVYEGEEMVVFDVKGITDGRMVLCGDLGLVEWIGVETGPIDMEFERTTEPIVFAGEYPDEIEPIVPFAGVPLRK